MKNQINEKELLKLRTLLENSLETIKDSLKKVHNLRGEMYKHKNHLKIYYENLYGVFEITINKKRVGSLFSIEENAKSEGSEVSGHHSSICLSSLDGTWYNEQGEEVFGNFYFKPNKQWQ